MSENVRVLIVDDTPRTVENLKRLLAFETDIEVVGTAGSARGGIEAAHHLLPDLVLMDVNLPDMDGIKATRTLGAELPLVPVVMISVQEDREYLRQAMQAGAREYLVKPFSADELVAAIRRVSEHEVRKRRHGTLPPEPARAPEEAEAAASPDTQAPAAPVETPPFVRSAPPANPSASQAPVPAPSAEQSLPAAPPEAPPTRVRKTLPPKPGSGTIKVPSVSWAPGQTLVPGVTPAAPPAWVPPGQTVPPVDAAPPTPAPGHAGQTLVPGVTAPPGGEVPPPAPAPAGWEPAATVAPAAPPVAAAPPAPTAVTPPVPIPVETAPEVEVQLPPVPPPLERKAGLGQVVAVYSGRGGAGKTTVAINLAASIARETGEDVALVDLDLQFGDVAMMLGVEPPGTWSDLVDRMVPITIDMVGSIMPMAAGNIRILAAPLRPELADLVTAAHARQVIELLKQAFDHVIIDLGSHIGDVALDALEVADRIVMLTDLQLPGLKQAKLAYGLFEGLGISRDKVVMVLNQADTVGRMSANQAATHLRAPFAVKIPTQEKMVLEAVEKAQPLVDAFPESDIARKFRELAGCLVPLPDLVQTQKAGKRRLFGRTAG